LAMPVLDLIPEPLGTPWWKKEGTATVEEKPKKCRKAPRKKSSGKKPPEGKFGPNDLLDLLGSD